jgi:hypothetical protein
MFEAHSPVLLASRRANSRAMGGINSFNSTLSALPAHIGCNSPMSFMCGVRICLYSWHRNCERSANEVPEQQPEERSDLIRPGHADHQESNQNLGEPENSVMYDRSSGRLFVGHKPSKSTTVIRASSGEIEKAISMGGKSGTASDGAGSILVNINDQNEIVRIDAKSMTIKSRWPLNES